MTKAQTVRICFCCGPPASTGTRVLPNAVCSACCCRSYASTRHCWSNYLNPAYSQHHTYRLIRRAASLHLRRYRPCSNARCGKMRIYRRPLFRLRTDDMSSRTLNTLTAGFANFRFLWQSNLSPICMRIITSVNRHIAASLRRSNQGNTAQESCVT